MPLYVSANTHILTRLQKSPWGRTLCGRDVPMNDWRIRNGDDVEVTCKICRTALERKANSSSSTEEE